MKITVIVPVYNVESYLEECLQSLLCQTEPFDEILLVNDGSTDGSREICEKYRDKYAYIGLVNQENQGLAAARNVGLQRAVGDYIVFVDSDDYVSQEMCSRIKEGLASGDIEVLYYNAVIQEDIPSQERKGAFRHKKELDGLVMDGLEYYSRTFPLHYSVVVWIAAYQKGFLMKHSIMFREGMFYEDNLFSLQVISNAKKVSCISDNLYIRRCREDSIMTGQMTEKKLWDKVINIALMWKYLAGSEKWLRQGELLKRTIALDILRFVYNLPSYLDEKSIVEIKQRVVELFLQYWMHVFQEGEHCWEIDLGLYLILRDLQLSGESGRKDFFSDGGRVDREASRINREIEDSMRRFVRDKLCVPLLSAKHGKMGIYGIGKHTSVLLKYCRETGGLPQETFFIVSSRRGITEYQGRPVLECNEIPENTDLVIISSFLYQEEMYESLREQGVPKEKIIQLYEGTELCGMEMADWVINDGNP